LSSFGGNFLSPATSGIGYCLQSKASPLGTYYGIAYNKRK
jgi:hypothetical protein